MQSSTSKITLQARGSPAVHVLDLTDPATSKQWDHYVESHSEGSVFHTTAWQRLIETSFHHRPIHLAAREPETGKLVGVLPLFLVNSRIFGRMLVSTPQAAYGGIIADSPADADSILAEARRIAFDQDVRFLELRNFRNSLDKSDLIAKDLYVTFRQELLPDPDSNMLSIPRKTRAEIREGMRNGLEFRVDETGVSEFYYIYSRSVRDLGTPVFSKRLFAIGLREFGSRCKIFSVYWKGIPVSAVWTLFHKDEVIPYYGGSIREYNRFAVNNFMYWMLIKYGCENGYKTFDFGRSKKGTGSFSFKKHWGMNMINLPYQYALVRQHTLPDTSPLNPKFSLSIRVWRRLPLFVANSLGPIISRHLI